MFGAAAWYREYAPCKALREYVRTLFCLSPELSPETPGRQPISRLRVGESGPCAPPLADGHLSLVFCFENAYLYGHGWRSGSAARGWVIGPMTAASSTSVGAIPERVGVSLRAGRSGALLGVPGVELADRVVAIDDLWGRAAASLPADLAGLPASSRMERLESVLLRRLSERQAQATMLDVAGVAGHIVSARGIVRIEDLAGRAGVSRQHLTRSFRDALGVTPKLFARLVRFHAGLAYAGRGEVDWAQAALDLGYADQSHMIADFREFSTLTPEVLAARNWFHPFIHRARRRRGIASCLSARQEVPGGKL